MKRGGDLAVAALAGIVAVPLALAIAVLLRWAADGPVLLRLPRAGRHGRVFHVLRFRTDRRGRIGELLRRTGLDELPRLWNVARGEMGVVGGPAAEQAPGGGSPPPARAPPGRGPRRHRRGRRPGPGA
ncbi:sugar transferase, partial [Kitasatospora sp. NPDC059747]|uniref:sugar transferase n=1 Tax=Kitasatospora sp. NPDC059747 TaxID=3346930 RepID=UPI00365AABAE